MKVQFLDKRILHKFYGALSVISVITSIVFLFIDIDTKYKTAIGLAALSFLIVLYIGIWVHSNFRQNIKLKINTSQIEVKFGDIFSEQADLKVIAFNEYFDTLVDDKIIAKSSLNGIFVDKFFKNKVDELDGIISSETQLTEASVGENPSRPSGKKIKYKLGTICVVNDYLITALTHFDDNNKAYLEINDYINCLLNFWNEVDRVYAGRTVALPVLGSGITRFKGYENISDQELLELIIWTFKVSRIKFTYPSKVKIVVYKNKCEKIDLLALKDLET
ncbi:macro domain-containing protein [Paenibacillus naphthalenovorans]|uniref:Thoeris protein ThsA Macro domain-containing protein n=1 Tax=Paenibacillus naphthalenovorans TaxID=162209 RepID=A0A0U2WG61_9BACL|nr:macro domain-containing protein [Paenibacillus naphthalenovorans]ALS25374.1 hypothetical protein IJ22_51150 [Paenibacillus naphthalenovorans]